MTNTVKHSGFTIADNNGLKVIDCKQCGFAHLDPLPIPERVKQYYNEDKFYTRHSPVNWLYKEMREYNQGLWDSAYQYQCDLLNTDQPLIDVGSGLSTFGHYWTLHTGQISCNLEPSKNARSLSRIYPDIFVHKDMAEIKVNYPLLYKSFGHGNNIRMSLVLEHIRDPLEFLNQWKQYMNNDSRMMIIVPNEFNRLQKSMQGSWFVSNVHINYFTPVGLENLLWQAGLSVIHQSSTFPIEIFSKLGIDYRGRDEIGKKIHRLRLVFEKSIGKHAFKLYEKLYRKYGIGRELIFVAKRVNKYA